MTMPLPKRPWIRAGVLAGIAAILAVLPCVAPGPTDAKDEGGETGYVAGTVRDAATDQPLGSVQVYVDGTGRGTLSSQEGRFRIEDVPVGEREVVAHLIGYGDVRQGVAVPTNETATVELGMRATAVPLEPLVVRLDGQEAGG